MKQIVLPAIFLITMTSLAGSDLGDLVAHGHTDNNGMEIHYASLGKGPLIVMIHGFLDYQYTWRHQIEALSQNYQVVAINMRGYNRSNKPKSVENYDMKLLVGDIVVLIHHCKQDKTILVGHDWEVGWWCDSLQ